VSGAWKEFEEESRSASRRVLVFGAVLAVVVLAALRYFGGNEGHGPAESPAGPVTVDVTPTPTFRLESVTEIPPPSGAQSAAGLAGRGGSQTVVGVYECVVNGQRVLSDRPCGPEAQARTVVVDQPDSRDVAQAQQRTEEAQASSAPRAYSQPQAASGEAAAAVGSTGSTDASACAAVDQAIAVLNARMRQPYTSQEGEWLRAEWHRLQDQRAALNCGR
jgi:hypothetical protein